MAKPEELKNTIEKAAGKKGKFRNIDEIPQGTKGKKLPKQVKTALEEQFNGNFNKVQVHTGGNAAEVAKSIKARAFTVGNNIYLLKPADYGNHKLLAHELTHVVQQSNGRIRKEKAGKAVISGSKPK
jgi:uncharacterized protein DUF4157